MSSQIAFSEESLGKNNIYLGVGIGCGLNQMTHYGNSFYGYYNNSYHYNDSSGWVFVPSVFVGANHVFSNKIVLGFEWDINIAEFRQKNNLFDSSVSNIMNFSTILGFDLYGSQKLIPFVAFGPSLGFYNAKSDPLSATAWGTMGGIKVGTGISYAIYSNLSLRLEYFYNHLWTDYVLRNSSVFVQSSIHNLRFGVSYSFNFN